MVETSLPTPMTARVYVNLLEGNGSSSGFSIHGIHGIPTCRTVAVKASLFTSPSSLRLRRLHSTRPEQVTWRPQSLGMGYTLW